MAPLKPSGYVDAGFIYHEKKEFNKAMYVFTKALSLNPYHSSAHYGLALVLEELERYTHWQE